MDRRKRPMSSGEEDSDEEKMEKFYALIKSYREARHRLRIDLRHEQIIDDVKKKKHKEEEEGRARPSRWVPAFEREDFADKVEFGKFCAVNKSCKQVEKKKEEEDCLDLKLAL